ncbi:MAG TPA: hypothetical protein VFK65_00765 [Candidatus Binatia bacterium]|jgi:hypothetical protein|nr:hypothetical protein [Candidatus Binatia bacterium]
MQLDAALRTVSGVTFQLVLVGFLQVVFLLLKKLTLPFCEVNIFTGAFDQAEKIAKAVFLVIHRIASLRLQTIS